MLHTVPDEKDKSKQIDKTREYLTDIYDKYGKNNLFEVRVNINSAMALPVAGEKY